jgi:hypothetical protein
VKVLYPYAHEEPTLGDDLKSVKTLILLSLVPMGALFGAFVIKCSLKDADGFLLSGLFLVIFELLAHRWISRYVYFSSQSLPAEERYAYIRIHMIPFNISLFGILSSCMASACVVCIINLAYGYYMFALLGIPCSMTFVMSAYVVCRLCSQHAAYKEISQVIPLSVAITCFVVTVAIISNLFLNEIIPDYSGFLREMGRDLLGSF